MYVSGTSATELADATTLVYAGIEIALCSLASRSEVELDDVKSKVKIALDENRTLVLGVQILLGFEYSAVLNKGFDQLPEMSKYLKIGSHSLLLVTFALLLMSTTQSEIANRGNNDESFARFITKITGLVLLPFALSLGIDVYVTVERIIGQLPAILVGAGAVLVALIFWYGIEAVHLAGSEHQANGEQKPSGSEQEQPMKDDKNKQQEEESGQTSVEDKVSHVLTETRVVLPGAQALLGFQLVGVLTDGFEKLPAASKYMHLASLVAVALSAILLMAPAAYHRIAERGESTAHFHDLASRMVIAAMAVLAIGLSGDFYVVVVKILNSTGAGIVAGVLSMVLFYGLWFGFSLAERKRHDKAPAPAPMPKRRPAD